MASRFVLLDEKQSCVWQSPSEMPEVYIAFANVINTFPTYEDATDAARQLLAEKGARATYADVRPIEECALCGSDFATRQSHHTLVVNEEIGDETNPQILRGWYVARCCPGCGAFAEVA